MLIPSIDLMGGRIVQLVQGEKLRLSFDDFEYWIERFSKFPLVQLIDLDAAMRQGDNSTLVAQIALRLPCQVGGGIRSIDRAQQVLSAGAKRVIIGSALFSDEGKVNDGFDGIAAEYVVERNGIAAISFNQGSPLHCGAMAPAQVVKHDRQITCLREHLACVAANISSTAGYEYLHCNPLTLMQGDFVQPTQ